MSTVRFRLDNEQLPLPAGTSTGRQYQIYTRSETKSERNRFIPSPGTVDQSSPSKFDQTFESFGSGGQPLFQSFESSPVDSGPPILEHTGRGIAENSLPKMDGTLVHHSSTRVHQTTDYKPVQQELFDGRMERPFVGSVERQRPGGAQHVQLGSYSPGGTLLSDAPDTDLCLSMVNETRPSYQMKTAGKKPLTPPHLVSLINSSEVPKRFSEKPQDIVVSPSSSYKKTYSSLSETQNYNKVPAPSSFTGAIPAPPPVSSIQSSGYGPTTRTTGSLSPTGRYKEISSSYSSSYSKTTSNTGGGGSLPKSRLYTEFDPDSVLKDLKLSSSPKPPPPPYGSSSSYSTNAISPPRTGSPSGRYPYTSPNAKGLAPPPTDQPVRNPVRYGIEGNVDAMTIRMLRNMETGYGAIGEHNCVKCGEGIFGSRPGCRAMDKTYHVDCFTCSVCNCKLSGSPFYAVDDKQYCERDYIDTLDKCVGCQKPIKDRILRASGKAYHPQCFVCASCFRELDGVQFTVDSNNVNYCVQCFHEKFAPRCAVCHKPIAPEEGKKETTRVVAMDRSYHVECYKCEDCGMQLSSAIEGHGCYPLDNHLLCKNCNTARIRKLTAA